MTAPDQPATYAHAIGVRRAVRGPRWEVWHAWRGVKEGSSFRAVSSFPTRARADAFAAELRAYALARNQEAARLSHISRAINKASRGASG